jgi:hypothetical protein
MKGKLFTLEKPPFLTIASTSFSLTFKYFEDLRKALPRSEEYSHAFTLFTIFLVLGTLAIGLYIGFTVSEKNVARNVEKNKKPRPRKPGNR